MSTVSTVQALFPSPDDSAQSITSPASQAPLAWFTDQLGASNPALTLLAPTIAQVSYWRELCGVINGLGKQGIADDAWPADQAPSRSTLRALEERFLLVRRDRAWHLRRNWYTRLGALRLRAVPTPPLEVLDAPGEGLPTYRELQACEQIARWLDAQPRRRARLPFTGLLAVQPNHFADEEPLDVLRIMRKHKLVRHTNGCQWALSPHWHDKLRALWNGLERSRREWAPNQERDGQDRCARVVASGIDTWYLNWLTEEGLPPRLEARLDDLQAEAREQEAEIDTRWQFDGAPLQMYQYGVSAKGPKGEKGVSWAFILRNPSLTLKIRRMPLGTIIAQARLGSECLGRLTPLRALNELSDLLREMWGKVNGRLQVSEIHLAADLVNFPLTDEGLARFVSRSRKQATYEAARRDVELLLQSLRKSGVDGLSDLGEIGIEGIDWGAEFGDVEDDNLFGVDPFSEDNPTQQVSAVEAAMEEPLDDRSRTTYRYGLRYSGVSWSLGASLSVVLYDKTLQARLTNRRHMEPIWSANGLEAGERVTRCEVRIGRSILHDLRQPNNSSDALQMAGVSPFDDPWFCVKHLPDLWAMAVGQPREECPDAVNVAWIRQVTPLEGDTNRSRWPTDPAWAVLQRASFTPAPVAARRLIRRRQTSASLTVLVSGVSGYLVSEVARAHPNGGQYDISAAIGEVAPMLTREFEKPTKDFGELVRERRRRWGLSLPPAEKILPFRSAPEHTEEAEDAAPAQMLDADLPDNASDQERARWRVAMAERRLQEAEQAHERATRQGKPARLLTRLRADVEREMATFIAASDRLVEAD